MFLVLALMSRAWRRGVTIGVVPISLDSDYHGLSLFVRDQTLRES